MISLPNKTLVIASHNLGKIKEIAALLAPLGLHILSAADLNITEPEETESTFIGNAKLKAEAVMKASGLAALADDSGLSIPALGGQPGVYSARWAGPSRDFNVAMQKVEEALQPHTDHRAYFICILALALPEGDIHTFEGQVWGTLVFPPREGQGFGYDPIFQPEGYDQTFAEMEPQMKHSLSHRKRAFDQLMEACFV